MAGFAGKSVDPAIVERARRGDMRAHEIVYRAFSAPVYSLLARMTGSTAIAEDLVQETFIEVIRSIDRFRGDASLATWIRKIAVSKCLMHLRSAWQNRATLFRDLGESHPAAEPRVADEAATVQAYADLERALARLSDVSRVVVILHDIEGYTHREIAALMGKSVSFSKSQLARAHRRLRSTIAAAEGQDAGEQEAEL